MEVKVVLLTGGSSGIGAATAHLLADAGMKIYAASRRSNNFVLGPVVIQPERRASATSAISSSVMSGELKLILSSR